MSSRRKWDAGSILEFLSCGKRSTGSTRHGRCFPRVTWGRAAALERRRRISNRASAHRWHLTTCPSVLLPSGRRAALVGFQGGPAVPFTESAIDRDRDEAAAVAPRRCARSGLTAARQWAGNLAEDQPLILRVFLPFVAGYYLAYLFRTINAVIAAPLATELGLSAGDLGLLTSVYFLTFAAAQIPIGILLDRYGPRRVQRVLVVIAAIGSALFAVSDHFWMLLVGRALIGLGVAFAVAGG